MITTVLTDLDGTLLENNMDAFVPAYLNLLATHLSEIAPPERIVQELQAGTRAMLENNDPTLTLHNVFAGHFYPNLGHTESELQARLEIFYLDVFPDLRALTRPADGARPLVEKTLAMGLEIVIATSPLFPLTAIEQRLDWAGLSVRDYPFALITSYERIHFSKPKVAYFAEVLGRLGRTPEQAVMIGNDPKADLEPASALGMQVFHIGSPALNGSAGGDLGQALKWLESDPQPQGAPAPQPPEVILARMRAHLAALTELARNLSDAGWRARPGPASWAPVEIICHMRDVEREVNGPRYHALLSESGAFVPAADPDRWAAERGYLGQDGDRALGDFCRARLENVRLLQSTSDTIWNRPALHAIFGPTNLAELVSFAADHDVLHLDQLRRALSNAKN